ncbi:MAG: response regulator [Chloroflexota bacterium]|nr:response regulator [Dehalococcoidia bacterium]MDW8254919.1 response regulator [Chloroflexota bacterium]
MTKTVLVIEDDAPLRQTIQEVLEIEGYRVVTAADGEEALAQLDRAAPNVILLDLMMPRMNGYQFAAAVARHPRYAAIPIVLLTADGRAPEKASDINAAGWLNKPFSIDELTRVIDEAVR